ncbi:hypothetical protein M5689_003376 [Euphorbia peplus]|nr:hypothetical protein M5689_003376 [Euphorbia peplus]
MFSYQKLKHEEEEEEERGIKKRSSSNNNPYNNTNNRSSSWLRLKRIRSRTSSSGSGRKRFKVKIPSLSLRRRVKAIYNQVLNRFKLSHAHFGDLFAVKFDSTYEVYTIASKFKNMNEYIQEYSIVQALIE